MTPEPLVSVIIPTYNRSSILFNTIKKVFNQTWENMQLIIVDDYSSDDTRKTIQLINDSRIKYKRTERNLGCAGARSLGVQSSEGEFITFLDDDDEWKNNYLKNQLQVFKEYPLLDFVICDYQVQNIKSSRQFYNMKPFSKNFKRMIHKRPGPFFQCCMFRNKILEDIKDLFDSNAVPSEDWDFFINLSMRNPSIGHSPNIDFKWNYSKSSQSANLLSEAKSLNYITNKHKESILQFCGRIVLSDHFRRIARLYEQLDDFQTGKTFYKQAFFSAPWWWKNFLYIILLSLGYKVSTKLIYLGRKYRI